MLYKTHKVAGVLACLVAYDLMRRNGQLAPDINDIVQLAIIYPACSWASTAPDLDHALSNVKEQTPFNLAIHKLLHIGKCNHRSIQTHSILFTGGFCVILCAMLLLMGNLGTVDNNSLNLLRLMLLGVTLGITSHLIMDSLTVGGIWLIPKVKIRFVPNRTTFGTGGKWEDIVRAILYIFVAYMVIRLIVGWSGYSLTIGNVQVL